MNDTEKSSLETTEAEGMTSVPPKTTKPEENKEPIPFTDSATGQYSQGFNSQPNTTAGNTNQSNQNTAGEYGFTRQWTAVSPLRDRDVVTLGNAVGFPLSMFFVLNIVFQILLSYILYIISAITGRTSFPELSDPNIQYIYSSCVTIFTLTVPYLFTLKATNSAYSDLVSVKRVSGSSCLAFVMLGLGASVLCNLASNTLGYYSDKLFGIKFINSAPEYEKGPWSFALMLLCVGILPAILEEFAIRGVILGALRKRFSDTSAIVISSVLFGLLHGNLQQIPFAALLGLLLGFATVYTGSIIPAVLIHAVNNINTVVISFAIPTLSPLAQNVVYFTFIAVSLIIGLCGFITLIKSDPDIFRLSTEKSELTSGNLFSFLSSPWIIIFLALCVLEVLLVQGVITLV